jgi:hypothetical protein
MFLWLACAAAAGTLLVACSDAPFQPSSTDRSSENLVRGRTIDATSGAAEGSVTVQIGDGRAVAVDQGGFFQASVMAPGSYWTLIRGTAIVERQTRVTAPASDALLSLIPATFNLQAFDELARTSNARLQRWTTRPSLVIVASVMAFKADTHDGFTANGEKMTDLEVSGLTSYVTEGLSIWSGGGFTSFASTTVERPLGGDAVSVKRPGKIVVGRYTGMDTSDGTIGFTTWLEASDGTVTGGSIFLDEAFDRDDNRRRLLRIHELGHAMGYQHVTTLKSIMNPIIGPDVTEFDRSAATIAFQRPPGNHQPDRDPDSTRVGTLPSGAAHWARPVKMRRSS